MIPDEAVEAAARASNYYLTFDAIKVVLEAASPHMLASVTRERDEARAAVDQLIDMAGDTHPYRSQRHE